MAITLVADLSQAGANAYCDVAFADAFMETRGFNSDWTTADPEVKKQTLIWATNLFETMHWQGKRDKVLDPGPLRFPRRYLKDREGDINTTTSEIPLDIKKGLCEMALFMIREDRMAGFDVIQADTSQIGPIGERKLKYNKFPPGVIDYIGWYLNGGTSPFQIRVNTGE